MILLAAVLFILFLFHTWLMLSGKFNIVDQKVYHSFKIKEPWIKIFSSITNLACTLYFVIVSLFLLIILPTKKVAIAIIIGLIIDSILVWIIKHMIKRERPKEKQLVKEKGFSYVSGHTFTATFFYGLIIFFLSISSIILPLKILLILFFVVFIFTIALTRIYLGVHYFSDTVGGVLFGLTYLFLYLYFMTTILNVF